MTNKRQREQAWNIVPSKRALSIINPIRDIVDKIGKPESGKSIIPLSQGDPSAFGNLPVNEVAKQAVIEAVTGGRDNGYGHSCGAQACREAVAAAHSPPGGVFPVSPDHIFMSSGCSQAIEYAIAALARPDANILLPKPGFPLYEVICGYYNVECRFYSLHADLDFRADVNELHALSDENTVALLVCNPSNPTGTNYNIKHLTQLVNTAEALKVPIIADEVYHGMVFEGETFHPLGNISTKVPILTVGAISKRFLVPGWRVGWLVTHDRDNLLAEAGVLEALRKLTQISLGPCSIMQAAVPKMLTGIAPEWTAGVMTELARSAEACIRRIEKIPGLKVASKPTGAMYVMVHIESGAFKGVSDDVDFANLLMKEQSVVVLPGQAFKAPNMFRVCFAGPVQMMEDAFDRIAEFCSSKYTDPSKGAAEVPEVVTPENSDCGATVPCH